MTMYKGANGSVPFTNWRIERELKVQNVKEIIRSLEWNVSYSNLTELTFHLVIFSAFKCYLILINAGTESKVALFHVVDSICR